MRWLRHLPALLATTVVVGAAVFVGVNLVGSSTPPDGPIEPVWDREACAHCRMHVGEPSFAVQLQRADGEVLFFDDPGCALRMLDGTASTVHALYFHHLKEDRWIRSEHVAFVPVAQSPMGFGFGAVDAGTKDALSLEQVRVRTRRKE